MPPLIHAPALAGFVPPASAPASALTIASPGTMSRSLRTGECRRPGRAPRPDPGPASAPTEGTTSAARARVGSHLPETSRDARSEAHGEGLWSPDVVPGRCLDWLRAGAAMARYSLRFLPAVLRPHSFTAPPVLPVLRTTTSLPERRLVAWKAFFQHPEDPTPPFTWFTPENSRLLFRLLGEFGLNFRHLLLVQHELVAGSGANGLVPDAEYALEARVEELRVWPRQRVTLACRCVARRVGHPAPVFETCDRFLVKEVPGRDCEALERRRDVPLGTAKEPPVPRLDPASPSVRTHPLPIPMDAGLGFGLLSGDLNLVHAHVGLARLFGHRRPFAQGLYTSNRVVAALSLFASRRPTRFAIRFGRPLYLGQEARLLHSERAFEVLDANGSLVAAGTYGD